MNEPPVPWVRRVDERTHLAAYRAQTIYAKAFERHAELQTVLMFVGQAHEAQQHGIAADIARRAWQAEWKP